MTKFDEDARFEKTGKKAALILEGGGFRGIYTAGVLDRFLEENIHFPYIIGVSMGAINGINYVANQKGRMLEWCARYIPDRKYMGMQNLIKEGNFFSHDYGFNREARRFMPYDFKSFYRAPEKFFFCTTDVETGKARYFEKLEDDAVKLSLASTAVPMLSQMVPVQNGLYLDGGVGDPIPVLKPQEDGNEKLVFVLTRPKGYRKGAYVPNPMVSWKYKDYPNLLKAFEMRNQVYNESLDIIEELERKGEAFVYRINDDTSTAMVLRDVQVLEHNYNYGYSQADVRMAELMDYLKN